MRSLYVLVWLGALPMAAAQPAPDRAAADRDRDALIDDDPTATCRAEHAARRKPTTAPAWTPPTCLHHARLLRDRIELLTKVAFEFNKYIIRPASFAILDDVAAILLAHPELYVEVQGHYREPGYSLKLSDRRAHAVLDYLVHRGVDPRQLYANGYGEDMPLVRATDKDATTNNWRIELRLRERPPPSPGL